ncbi:MaoC family dehydratase (plasmid) [Haloferax sp. S1W]|uniref:MaoC family dehydratase n=1 Tax=Haloferax sp. S1W TaxID=3377110 RepID=UPI0037C8B4CD
MAREKTADRTTPPPLTGMQELTATWLRASQHFANSVLEANRATLAAFGFSDDTDDERNEEQHEATTGSVAYDDSDWEVTRTVDSPDDIETGDTVTFSKTLTEEDIQAFAHASGDTNRLHLDDSFARKTRFGGRIAHGTLVSGLISAALARLPGSVVYLSQDTRFLSPVEIGSRLTAKVEVAEVLAADRYRLSTAVTKGDGEDVIDGEAVVLVDPVPDTDE